MLATELEIAATPPACSRRSSRAPRHSRWHHTARGWRAVSAILVPPTRSAATQHRRIGATRLNRSGFARTARSVSSRLPLDIGVYDLVVRDAAHRPTSLGNRGATCFRRGSASTGLRQVSPSARPSPGGHARLRDGDVCAICLDSLRSRSIAHGTHDRSRCLRVGRKRSIRGALDPPRSARADPRQPKLRSIRERAKRIATRHERGRTRPPRRRS